MMSQHTPMPDPERSDPCDSPITETPSSEEDDISTKLNVLMHGKEGTATIATDDRPPAERELAHENQGTRRTSQVVELLRRVGLLSTTRDADYRPGQAQTPRPWKESFLRVGPLTGILCLFVAALSTTASLGILAGSDKQLVTNWAAPPSAYIAVCTAIANLSMRYAAFQGVIVMWWRRSLRGESLVKLHWDWRAGTSIRGAVTAGRNMGWLGLACIFATVVVVDGPLLQRASSVVSEPIVDRTAELKMSMVPEIPTGYGGSWAPQSVLGATQPYNSVFAHQTSPSTNGPVSNMIETSCPAGLLGQLTKLWYHDQTLPGIAQGCPGSCTAKLTAPALAVTDCKSEIIPVDYNVVITNFNVTADTPFPLTNQAFKVNLDLVVDGEQETIDIITAVSHTKGCVGSLNQTVCTLRSAVGEYDVQIENDVVTLSDTTEPSIVSLAQNAPVNHTAIDGSHSSTLAAIVMMLVAEWTSYVVYMDGNGQGIIPWIYGPQTSLLYNTQDGSACASFEDPLPDLLSDMNRAMIYLGWLASNNVGQPNLTTLDPGTKVDTTVTGQVTGSHTVYRTNYWYLLGAALVELVCIALVAPTYWGWWKIGRPVSFSPLELAKICTYQWKRLDRSLTGSQAFEAPILDDVNSNSSALEIATECVNMRVKYGFKEAGEAGRGFKLAFGATDAIQRPAQGPLFV